MPNATPKNQPNVPPRKRLPFRPRKWLNTWRRLGWRDRSLLFEALVLLGMARATVLFIPFKRVAPHLGQAQHATAPGDPSDIARRVAKAIYLVSRHTPWDSNCFAQALAGHVMLRRRHAASTLYLGVYKKAEEFAAHAWIRHADLIVTGGPGQERYTVIACYGWQPPAATP